MAYIISSCSFFELQESSKKPAKLTAWRVFCFLSLQEVQLRLLMGLHQRQGQAPSMGSFSDRFLINSPADSPADFPNHSPRPLDQEVTMRFATAISSAPGRSMLSSPCEKTRFAPITANESVRTNQLHLAIPAQLQIIS